MTALLIIAAAIVLVAIALTIRTHADRVIEELLAAEQDRRTDADWLAGLAEESTPVYDALVCESIEKAEGWA